MYERPSTADGYADGVRARGPELLLVRPARERFRLLPSVKRHLRPAFEMAMEGAGGGVHELLGEGASVDPADLCVLTRPRFSGSPLHS